MAFDFPSSPTNGQVYGAYTYDGEKWTSGTGYGAIYISDSAPAAPVGSLWWESDTSILYVRYNDGSSTQWVAIAGGLTNLQGLTEAQKAQVRQNVYAAPFDAMAYSGMQVNGSFDISQARGITLFAMASGTAYEAQDGWKVLYTAAGVTINCYPAYTPSNLPALPNCLLIQCTTGNAAQAAGDNVLAYTAIEGYRVVRLGWGTVNAQPITIGFWVSATRAGNIAVSVHNGANNRSYIVDVPVAAATWEYKTVTIPGDTSGTWLTTNGIGLYVHFCFGSGATGQGAANTWLASGAFATSATTNQISAAANIFLTGVVVLPGIEAPSAARSPLIMRPYDQELTMCKRYWHVVNDQFTAVTVAAGGAKLSHHHNFPIIMRAFPTSVRTTFTNTANTTSIDAAVIDLAGAEIYLSPSALNVLSTGSAAFSFDARL